MAKEKFDCIVIGGGPAGSTAAYLLAKNSFKVCLIERGDYPGTKNVMGGILYSQPTLEILPGFYKEAPLERQIIEQQIWWMTTFSALKFTYRSTHFNIEPYNNFSVLRAKFDKWFAEKVDEAGVFVIPKTQVTDFIKEGSRFTGVKTDRPDGDLKAKVLILAEGANSILAVKAGLAKPIEPKKVVLAVKQILFLPEEKITERFNVTKNEGVAIEMYGDVTEGMIGNAFLYPNKNTISLGIGALVSDFVKLKIKPYELIERVKDHPCVKPLVKDTVIREYLAHLIPEKSYPDLPKFYEDGILVAGDAAGLTNPVHREGSNLAMTSGRFAAETILEAAKKNDFSKENLASYETKLENSFVVKDIKKYKNTLRYLEKDQQKIDSYVKWVLASFQEMMTVDGQTKKEKQDKIVKNLLTEHGRLGLVKDIYGLWRFLNEG